MKAVIIDDERLARQELKSLLSPYEQIEIIGEASNVDEATELIYSLQPDVIFLDINMPGKNGFELLESLDFTPEVIFVTAYDEYAINAFEVSALDYLLKPAEPERIEEAIKKLEEKIGKEERSKQNLDRSLLSLDDQIFIKDKDKCWFVKLGDVKMFESYGNYVRVYFGKDKPLILKSLNALEEKLDPKVFFRANRKFIINLKMVEGIENWFNGGLQVKLKGDMEVEISRRQTAKFKDFMSL